MLRAQPVGVVLSSPHGEPDRAPAGLDSISVALERPTPAEGVAVDMKRDTLAPCCALVFVGAVRDRIVTGNSAALTELRRFADLFAAGWRGVRRPESAGSAAPSARRRHGCTEGICQEGRSAWHSR